MLIIDAKAIPVWTRPVFEDMRAGGLSAVSIICSIWEDFETSMRSLCALKAFVAANSDIVFLVRDVADLAAGREHGRTGIILSWQNASGFNDHLPFVSLCAELGLRIVQIAFLTANAAGSGCYETVDRGLTPFGKDLVLELNDCGIAIDIAHIAEETARNIIEVSRKPVFYSQSSPHALMPNVRNKSDADMKRVADRGGVIAIASIPHYLPSGTNSTVDDMVTAILHCIDIVGCEAVAIGSDLVPGQPRSFTEYVSHDGGHGRRLMNYTTLPVLPGLESFRDYPNLLAAMEARHMAPSTIERILGTNLQRYFGDAWALPNRQETSAPVRMATADDWSALRV